MKIKGWDTLIEFIKFSMVGLSNTIISEGIYVVLIYFGMHYLPASFIGFSLSVLNAYYWNNKYVFKEDKDRTKRVWWRVLFKTYIAYVGGYLLGVVLLFLWMDVIKIERFMNPISIFFVNLGFKRFTSRFIAGIVAEGINLCLTVPINYIVNKVWAFKQK